MTKRREQGHYNAADRFVIMAYVDQYEVSKSHHLGTEPFDRIWRAAHITTTYLVLQSGQHWLVTSMSGAKMNDQGIVEMGPYKLFTTEDAAIMYALMMASQGKEIITFQGLSLKYRGVDRLDGGYTFVKIESDDLTHN